MADSAVKIVLKAVDEYSGVITGLNQGLELLGKGFTLLKDAAGLTFDLINKGVDLARVGGAFQEQRNQFENLARSYKLNGQEIINTVKQTSGNTISEFESIATATRAVSAGLSGKELADALLYVKRWSEATGQSFTAVAESVFTSLTSGRYAVLRQMGLVIEKGATLADITKAFTDGLQKFGDTGFNAADKLDSLNASQDDFTRKIGQGINNSEQFQKVLGGLADGLVDLIYVFDPAPISVFVDFLVGGVIDIYKAFKLTFPEIGRIIDDFFNTSASGGQGFSKALINLFFELTRSAATAVNGIIDIFSSLNSSNFLSDFANSIIRAFAFSGAAVSKVVGGIIDVIAEALTQIDQLALYYARKFPNIAEMIGLDDVDFSSLGRGLRESVGAATNALSSGLLDMADNGVPGLNDLNKNLESMKINLGDIDKLQNTALTAVEKVSQKYAKATDGLSESTSSIRIQLEDGSVQLIEKQLAAITSPSTRNTIGIDIEDGTLESLNAIKDATKNAKVEARLTIKDDERSRNIADYIIEKVGGVNWPDAMQKLMDAMLTMLIAAVSGEKLPIAITNFRAG